MKIQFWQVALVVLIIVGIVAFASRKSWLGVKNFNRNHPETQEGEVFITNTDLDDYHHIGWKTKRKGGTAYDIYGKPIGKGWPGCFPVFAQKSELEEAGVDPETVNEKRVKFNRI